MVSVIVSFYERSRHLLRCLDALELNRSDFDEVVIADDGSRPETVARVKAELGKYSFPIEYVWRESDQFELAATRNEGIKRAKGEYLIILDCDFLVMPGMIAEHIRKRKKSRFVVGRFKEMTESLTEELFAREALNEGFLEELYRRTDGDRMLRKLQTRYHRRNWLTRLRLAGPTKHHIGSQISIYREDLEKVNGYDENYVGWGGEDEDLGHRLIGAGMLCIPAIITARHLHMWHPRQMGDQHWSKGSNMEYFLRKDRPHRCANGLVDETGKGV
ncbi:glycosyltransferase [Pontiellaceae bacterium B1224]|nr:glycosyltransferase [Pontiellaceae bacterium B1224]